VNIGCRKNARILNVEDAVIAPAPLLIHAAPTRVKSVPALAVQRVEGPRHSQIHAPIK
jgi:hypothetical protein